MLYSEIINLLAKYNDILIYLEIFDGDISRIDNLYFMKREILNNFVVLLSLPKEFQEKDIIEKVENYLIGFQ